MKDILILVPHKFEDTELTGVADVFDRESVSYTFASINNNEAEVGSHFVSIKTLPLEKVNPEEYKGLFLPGGPGASSYKNNQKVVEIIKNFNDSKKLISAICAAPETLLELGLLENIKYTAHPNHASGVNKLDQEIVIDQNFVTGKDFMTSQKLGLTIAKQIKNTA